MKARSKSERLKEASFAKGGKDHMVKPQAAGPAKPAITGKAPTAAPGAKAARGGKVRPVGGTSERASPGRTGPRADE
jgi:hypothetical protein